MTVPSVIRSSVIILHSISVSVFFPLPTERTSRSGINTVTTDGTVIPLAHLPLAARGGDHNSALLTDPSILRYFRDIYIARAIPP